MAENGTTDLKVQIAGLKKDVQNVNNLNERLDTAIQKLTDVSTSIKSMLAVHEEKISRQEQIDDIIFGKLKERENEIDKVHRDLTKEIQQTEKRLLLEIKQLKPSQEQGANPRDIKIELAKEIIARFHDEAAADSAYSNFVNQFQKKQTPDDIEEVKLTIASSSIALPNLLKESGMLKSTSEAIRLIKQGAVKIDEQKIEDPKFQVKKGTNQTYQVGKRNFKKINVT